MVGDSLRYASPQVFNQLADPDATSSVEEDMSNDVYSFGVVAWEMLTRQRPWGDDSEEVIATKVTNGIFLPTERVGAWSLVRSTVLSIINATFVTDADERPSMAGINDQICKLQE